jgi:hypothetical protein
LRTLAARPCGACGALVDAGEGCEHWTPGAAVRRESAGFDQMWLSRALGGRQHALLADAARARDGVARSLGSRAVSVAGHRLAGRGLMERLSEKGTYRITDTGREALKRLDATAGHTAFDQLESIQHKSEGRK